MPTWTATSAIRRPGMLPIRKNFDGDVPVDGSERRLRMGGLHSFRSVAGLLQSAARMDRHGQSESVSGGLSLPGERRVRGALSLARDSRPAAGARRLEAAKKCWPCRRTFIRRFRVFWRARIVAAYDRKKPAKPELGEAVRLLRSWNGQMEKRTAGAAGDHAGVRSIAECGCARGVARCSRTFTSPYMAPAAIQRILESGGARIFSRSRRRAVNGAGRAPSRKAGGRKAAMWRAGTTAATTLLTIKHPVGSQLPAGRKLLQYRAGGDERFVDHHQTDFGDAGTIHAIHRGSGELGRIVEQHRYRAVRADSIAALQGPVGRLLRGPELPDAI